MDNTGGQRTGLDWQNGETPTWRQTGAREEAKWTSRGLKWAKRGIPASAPLPVGLSSQVQVGWGGAGTAMAGRLFRGAGSC